MSQKGKSLRISGGNFLSIFHSSTEERLQELGSLPLTRFGLESDSRGQMRRMFQVAGSS